MADDGRPQSERLVRGYVDGCWDIMHSGHFNAIRQAKSLCDVLVVGVHSDAEIEENKAVPVMRQAERYSLLEHIKWIGEIVHDVPYSPQIATLGNCNADFCVHGDDMPVNAQGVCAYDEMRNAGRLRIIKRTEGVSTTDLIGRLLTLSRHQHTEDTWKEQQSRNLGVRVNADDAIERCVANSSRPSCDAVSAALATLDRLAAGHNLPDTEVQALRNQIVACEHADTAAVSSSATPGGEAAVRPTAPVQLLASTRRITEFSSARVPTREDRVVYVCGSFDMFHVGHAQFLKDARALGTFLLVGIHDDSTVRDAKGVYCPVMNLNERVLNVCACKWVDEVIIGAPRIVTEDLMKTWDIHVVARGKGHLRDGKGHEPEDVARFAVPRELGSYSEVQSAWPDLCHETVVQRIIESREVYLKRNKDRAKREDQYYAAKDQNTSPVEA